MHKINELKYVRKHFGQHFKPYTGECWEPGMPDGLRKIDHLGTSVYIGDYQGKDTLDPFYIDQFSSTIVTDPGVRFLHVAFIAGCRKTVVFAPSLSGDITVCQKLIKKWSSEYDNAINRDPRCVIAKRAADDAEEARVSSDPEEQKTQKRAAVAMASQYHRTRQLVAE